jgi:hypothetical protein
MRRIKPYRQKGENYIGPWKIFPFAWTTCNHCKYQYRFERMWYAEIPPFTFIYIPTGGKIGRKLYICRNCCLTKNDMYYYLDHQKPSHMGQSSS